MERRLEERARQAAGTAGGPWPLKREEVVRGGCCITLILSGLVLSAPLLSLFSLALRKRLNGFGST